MSDYKSTQDRLLKARNRIGNLVPDLIRDFEHAAGDVSLIKGKYSDYVADIFIENFKHITDIRDFYRWIKIDYKWTFESPYSHLNTFNTFASLYRVNDEGWVIVRKILSDILNKSLRFA